MRAPGGPRARASAAACRAAAVLALFAGLLLLAAPASAHGQLVAEASVPVEGAAVGEALDALSLVFTETPSPFAFFAVTAPDGTRVDSGWGVGQPFALDEPVQELDLVDGVWEPVFYPTGFPVELRVAHWPAAGKYTVEYASVASDGEAVEGTYTFGYDGPSTPAPAGWTPPTEGRDPLLVEQLATAEEPGSETGGNGAADAPAGSRDTGNPEADEPSVAATAPGAGPAVQPAVYVLLGVGLLVVVASVVVVARRGRTAGPGGPAGPGEAGARAARRAGDRSGNPAVRAASRR